MEYAEIGMSKTVFKKGHGCDRRDERETNEAINNLPIVTRYCCGLFRNRSCVTVMLSGKGVDEYVIRCYNNNSRASGTIIENVFERVGFYKMK
jgi:hypothetical protein